MNNEYLVEVFGRTSGFVHQYKGTISADPFADITVAFCNAADDHTISTTVVHLPQDIYVIYADQKVETDLFECVHELTVPPSPPEPVEFDLPINEPPPEDANAVQDANAVHDANTNTDTSS